MQSVSKGEMEKMLEKEGEFVYYDFETRTDIDADGSKYYTPNCCVLQLQRVKKTENIARSLSWGTMASKN